LNDYGYQLLRFRNEELLNDLDSIQEQVWQVALPSQGWPPLPP